MAMKHMIPLEVIEAVIELVTKEHLKVVQDGDSPIDLMMARLALSIKTALLSELDKILKRSEYVTKVVQKEVSRMELLGQESTVQNFRPVVTSVARNSSDLSLEKSNFVLDISTISGAVRIVR